MIDCEAENDDEIKFQVITAARTLELNHKTCMSKMSHGIGCAHDTKEKVIPGNAFAAMADEGQFKLEQ